MWRLASVVVVVSVFVGGCLEDSDERPPEAPRVLNTPIALADSTITLTGWPLRTSNRSHVSVCVDGAVGFEITEEHRMTVQRALDDILGGIPDPVPELAEWLVVRGCPPAPNLFARGINVGLEGFGPKVSRPSEHLVFVYFLPEESEYFLPESFGLIQTTELSCVNYRCHNVTSGIYKKASADSEQFRNELLSALRFANADTPIQEFFLQVEERTHLSVCIDRPEGGEISDAELAAFDDVFERTFDMLPAVPEPLRERQVTIGCPEPIVEIATETGRYDTSSKLTEKPSKHRMFVYLLDEASYQATFGGEPFFLTSEEKVCPTDWCDNVTSGLYLSASTMGTEDWRYAIARGLNVVYEVPSGEPDIDLSACDRGESPHPDYDCERVERMKENIASLGTQIH